MQGHSPIHSLSVQRRASGSIESLAVRVCVCGVSGVIMRLMVLLLLLLCGLSWLLSSTACCVCHKDSHTEAGKGPSTTLMIY
jgi:hypothetical protein